MNAAEINQAVRTATAIEVELNEGGPMPTLVVPPESLLPVLRYLKDAEETKFNALMSQTGMHQGDEIVLYWHLYSYTHKHELAVESGVPIAAAKIASVVGLWSGADWLERETFDLLGVQFEGHPNLRRIMLPDDWEGYPLRKDYVNPETYQNLDNRPSEITQSFQTKGK